MALVFSDPYFILSIFAFGVNIPLGFIRQGCPKMTVAWFFWIHASIPTLIYLRLSMGIKIWFIPISILLAILGQIIGSCWCRQVIDQKDSKFKESTKAL